MGEPFQILPGLASDDFAGLRGSITERGVEVPIVVDEDGNILDGHHRAQIAAELGIECPRIVKAGLAPHEKRIFAVEVNLARRQLTVVQKVDAGRRIEADIAERARLRQEALGRSHGDDPSATFGTKGRTTDEVARTVGLGSGRTYERAKRVIEAVEREAPELLPAMVAGKVDLDAARKDLRERGIAAKREQAKAEQAESDRLLALVGDPDGRIARARLRSDFSKARLTVQRDLLALDPIGAGRSLEQEDADSVRWFLRDCRAWLDRLESAIGAGLHLVAKEHA